MSSRVLAGGAHAVSFAYHGYSGHEGIDLVAPGNGTDTIIAHSAGTVIDCASGHGNNQGADGMASYGNYVYIEHKNGYRTRYAHMREIYVSTGTTVLRGQAIGYMGNTGNSYGEHLHFEVHNPSNGNYDDRIDPTPFISADLTGYNTSGEPIASGSVNDPNFTDPTTGFKISKFGSSTFGVQWAMNVSEEEKQKKSLTVDASYLVFDGEYTPDQIQEALTNSYNEAPYPVRSRKDRLRKILDKSREALKGFEVREDA